jgi:hypothetical protein
MKGTSISLIGHLYGSTEMEKQIIQGLNLQRFCITIYFLTNYTQHIFGIYTFHKGQKTRGSNSQDNHLHSKSCQGLHKMPSLVTHVLK